MRKFWLLLLVPILILAGFGCVSTSEAPAADSLMSKITTAQTTADNALKAANSAVEAVSKKADKTEIDDVNRRINNLPQSTSGVTKDVMDAAILKAITDLKAGANPWNSVNNPPGTSDAGTVTFANNPAAIPQIFSSSSGGNSNPWIMTIKNNSTTWQYVKPVIQLNVASGQPSTMVDDVILMISSGSCSITGQLTTGTGNISFSPAASGPEMDIDLTPSLIMMPIGGCNGTGEIQVGPGQTQALNIQIQGLKTPNAILWNVTATISSRSM